MSGLIRGIAETAVVAGTWAAVSNRVSRRQAGRWAAEDQSKPQSYRPPPPGRYQRPMFQRPLHQYEQRPPNPQAYPPSYQEPVNPQPQPPGGPTTDNMSVKLAQLQQLGELKAQGTLTEEEFLAQKSKILS